LEPCEIVEDRVIHPVRSRRTDIARRHSQVLLKGAVIRTAAQIAHGNFTLGRRGGGPAAISNRFCRRLRRRSARLIYLLPRFVNRSALRAGHGLGYIAQESFETRRRRGPELRP